MNWSSFRNAGTLVGVVVIFFISIELLSLSFQHLSQELIFTFQLATSNPFVGLFIGLLTTAIIQSSSTTTTMSVVAVASGSLSLENAVPIIIGANIGTTITSTLVSMSFITKASEFKKAVSAGTAHDIFNILITLLIFPLEYYYSLLSRISMFLTHFVGVDHQSTEQVGAIATSWYASILDSIATNINPYIILIFSIALLFGTVKLISRILYKKLIGETKKKFETIVFSNTFKSFGWGALLTGAIQSSSVTTSLIVPLVATGKVRLSRAFQFILGANLGTTLTALLAALFKSEAAISLAFAHFLFNFIGIILFIAIPVLKKFPIYLADLLGRLTFKYRAAGFAYIMIVFFLLPFTLIYFSSRSEKVANRQLRQEVVQSRFSQ